jgi:hypothetical protein
MSVVKQLQEKIQEIQTQIDTIQEQCPHPAEVVTKEAKADTGNWCPQDDSYWYNCHCQLCDKHWTEDQ